jgi:hypothetical protein
VGVYVCVGGARGGGEGGAVNLVHVFTASSLLYQDFASLCVGFCCRPAVVRQLLVIDPVLPLLSRGWQNMAWLLLEAASPWG